MKLLVLFILFCLSITCCNNKKSTNSKIQKNNFVEFSQNFTINKKDNLTFISIINPETKSVDKILSINSHDPNFIWINNKKFSTNSIISFSSTFIGLLDKLNEIKRVKGIDDIRFVYNSFLKKQLLSKKTIELGSTESASIEKIISLNTETILFSGFGNTFPNEEKLKKLNILCIPIYDWRETHPLGKAEWIKVFGLMTNRENEANLYFNNLKKRYFKLKNKFKKLPLSKPILSGSIIGDFWYLPAGESYLSNIFKDARIDYVEKHTKGTGSISKSFEYCLKNYSNAYFWLNPGYNTKAELLSQNSNYKYFNALNSNTYCYSHSPNLFWEKSGVEPDKLLLDLIQICHPELHMKRNLFFYKKLK